MNITEKISSIKQEIQNYKLDNRQDLDKFRLEYLSKKSVIGMLFSTLNNYSIEEKKNIGSQLNALKEMAQAIYQTKEEALSINKPKTFSADEVDYTLPPPNNMLGAIHPIAALQQRIFHLFEKIGFSAVEGPEIEDDWHNFEALNFAAHHPARDMLDTFFIARNPDILLRTHTSSVQIRIASKQKPPIRFVTIGKTYRNETISARSHCMFHQIEGIYIHHKVSFADLKQVLYYFLTNIFGPQTQIRLRASYFPFTEPSVEIDIDCNLCKGKGCNVCKQAGWLEVLGAGMIDPQVLENCGIDSETYTGFAFGTGLERMAMLLHQINDLRLFTENDVRFLKQFTSL